VSASPPRPGAAQLHGAFIAAVPVPFDAAGRFAAAAQEKYIEYLRGQPVSGVAVWAHTGRGLHLEEELAREVLRSWRAGLADRLLVAGAGARAQPAAELPAGETGDAAYIELAVRQAESAAQGGADALLAQPPARFRANPERRRLIRRYHAALAAVGLPVIAFHLYEAAGGIAYTADELREILDLERVAALKMATLDSICTFQEVAALVARERPGTVLLSGEDRFLGYSFLRGAAGALVGMGAACAAMQRRLLDAALEGASERFIELLLLTDRFAECTFIAPMEGYIQRMLAALAALGVIPESATCDPWFPAISRAERERIAAVIQELAEKGEL
jgi:4-hydroxy-tetrahydrodipicolinate synthase